MNKEKIIQSSTDQNIITNGKLPINKWRDAIHSSKFIQHSSGFNVFLTPEQISQNDEYHDIDPYKVDTAINSSFHQRRIDLTCNLISLVNANNTQILDIGCGQGHITEKIRVRFPDAEISGIDYSITAIEYAHTHFPAIDFCVGNACSSPYASGYFDIVVCNNLWEHIPDPLNLLSEISRVLRPSGFLIISTPSRYRTSNIMRILKGKSVEFMSKLHVTEYTPGQVREQLEFNAFELQKIVSSDNKDESLKIKIAGCILKFFLRPFKQEINLQSTLFFLARKTC